MSAGAGRLLGGGGYQVGELLGYGGMAEVHRGRDLRLGRDVAIKTLRSDLARDATFQLRFRREGQNAAALNHPAIVAAYATGEEHGPSGEELHSQDPLVSLLRRLGDGAGDWVGT